MCPRWIEARMVSALKNGPTAAVRFEPTSPIIPCRARSPFSIAVGATSALIHIAVGTVRADVAEAAKPPPQGRSPRRAEGPSAGAQRTRGAGDQVQGDGSPPSVRP